MAEKITNPDPRFVIYNPHEGLFWSNEDGWVDPTSATHYSREETRDYEYIPGTGSYWVSTLDPEYVTWTDPLE